MCLWASFKKKYEKDYSFCILKKEPDPELNPDPYARGTDPGIRIQIRTKMSRFANTGSNCKPDSPAYYCICPYTIMLVSHL